MQSAGRERSSMTEGAGKTSRICGRCAFVLILMVGGAAALLFAGFAEHGSDADAAALCPRQVQPGRPGAVAKQKRAKQRRARVEKHTLAATGPANPINMSDTQGIGVTELVVGASPALPSKVKPRQITLTVPKRLERTGSNLSSEYLRPPTFSRPRILENGKLVAFRLCENVTGAQAGSYIGQVIVGGPNGVQPATIAITVNAKNQTFFWIGLCGAILLAFALLLAQAADKRQSKDGGRDFLRPCGEALSDAWGFWLPTLVAIGAAVVAVFQVWDSTLAWGADTGASLIALGGTALSAAGIGGFLSSIRGSSK